MSFEITNENAKTLFDYFRQRQSEIVALTRALVEIESPSGDLDGSRRVVELLSETAQTIDAVTRVERIAAEDDYGLHFYVQALTVEAEDERPVLILGHTDTVHSVGSLKERPWREELGRIYAPGVYDMKANCALALEALRACSALSLKPKRPVELLLTCDEETGSFSGRALVESAARRAASVLVLEPSAPGGRVKTARKGTGVFNVTTHGIAAHAGLEPEKGASAILEMARQIERLHSLSDLTRGTTVNVGVVCGGTRSNVIAAEARAEVDVRFSMIDEARRVENFIRNLHPVDERVWITVEGEINRPPLERTDAIAALYNHARRIASTLGFELGETSVGGASDGNFAAAVGAPVLDGLGVEGDGAHAVHEHIIVDDIPRRGALLAALIATV